MNKYYLYCETVDKDGDVCEKELIDIVCAESYEECMRESCWTGYDADDNEQYCIEEEDEYDNILGCYYPFGKASPQKYSDAVMRNVRQALDLEPDDTRLDREINEMDRMEVLEKWLQWEGIFGYTNRIKNVVDNIFYGKE